MKSRRTGGGQFRAVQCLRDTSHRNHLEPHFRRLPVTLMITGPRFSEGTVLALAHALGKAAEWHKRKRKLSPDMPIARDR